jgi:hypothetical protein
VWEGRQFIDIEFPASTKHRLDGLRRSVTPTIDSHHFYKTCGAAISSAVDMTEQLLANGQAKREAEAVFKRVVEIEFPHEGSIIEIEHVKLDGTILHLGRAHILTFNPADSSITYQRTLTGGGTYDGLGTPKEEGDYAVTATRIGEWWLKTRYFSKNHEDKGWYINLNTPIELYPWGIRYLDLEVDLIIQPAGEAKILDENKLKEKVKEGVITESLSQTVRAKLKELLSVKH